MSLDLFQISGDFLQKFQEVNKTDVTRRLACYNTPSLMFGCAVVSLAFQAYLRKLGIVAKVVTGHFSATPTNQPYVNHTYILVDNTIVDLTATQFNSRACYFPPVFITQATNPLYTLLDDNPSFLDWPNNQVPTPAELNALLSQLC